MDAQVPDDVGAGLAESLLRGLDAGDFVGQCLMPCVRRSVGGWRRSLGSGAAPGSAKSSTRNPASFTSMATLPSSSGTGTTASGTKPRNSSYQATDASRSATLMPT